MKKLLTALLIGTEAITLSAIAVAAFRVKRLVNTKIKAGKTKVDLESSKLSESDIQSGFLQDIVQEARNCLECDRVLIYSLQENN